MMNRLLLLLLPILLVSCNTNDNEAFTFLKCYFPNAKDSLVVLYYDDKPVDTAHLNKDKKVLLKLKIEEPKLYHFEIDGNYQYVYLEPQDSLVVFANTMNFNQSISFSGKSSAVNNFITLQTNNVEKETPILKNFSYLPPQDFKRKMDSVYHSKMREYNVFLNDNPELSEKAKKLALVSATFSVYKESEAYPFVYQRNNKKSIVNSLPNNFYDYRKDINFNNTFLEYYRPYYSYMVMFINNLAFKKYTPRAGYDDINKDEQFHLKKIAEIDSAFREGSLRDNLFRNAAYSYIFNIQNDKECECYIEEFNKYNQNNTHKAELDELFKSTIALQEGSIPPDFEIVDLDGNHLTLSEIVKPELTIFYFWSVNQSDMSSLILNRVLQLKTLFPEVKFVGIDVGQDVSKWCEKAPFTIEGIEQFHSTNFADLSRKYLINNISKSFILGEDTRIITAFESIFSPNIEKILLKN